MDKPWKVVLAFVGVFVAGVVFGGFFSQGVANRILATQPAPTVTKAPPTQPRPVLQLPPGYQAPQLLGRFVKQLDLSAEQSVVITPLVGRASEDYRRQWQNNVREMGFILTRLQNDIKKELTPQQQRKLEKLEQRQQQMLKESRASGAAPGQRAGQKNIPGGKAAPTGSDPTNVSQKDDATAPTATSSPPASDEPKKED